jgi:hypothetical protein
MWLELWFRFLARPWIFSGSWSTFGLDTQTRTAHRSEHDDPSMGPVQKKLSFLRNGLHIWSNHIWFQNWAPFWGSVVTQYLCQWFFADRSWQEALVEIQQLSGTTLSDKFGSVRSSAEAEPWWRRPRVVAGGAPVNSWRRCVLITNSNSWWVYAGYIEVVHGHNKTR